MIFILDFKIEKDVPLLEGHRSLFLCIKNRTPERRSEKRKINVPDSNKRKSNVTIAKEGYC